MSTITETPSNHRTPQQGRSRASFERMLETAEQLMIECGSEDFTLNKVAKLGKVSIGSIYCRFDSKDDLIREVHRRVMDRLDGQLIAGVERARAESSSLQSYIVAMVDAVAETLRQFAPVMRPFMLRANADPAIAEVGKASYHKSLRAVCAGLIEHREAIRHADPKGAAEAVFRILYASLGRYLGFDSSPEATGEGDWIGLKTQLTHMTRAYLSFSETAGGGAMR